MECLKGRGFIPISVNGTGTKAFPECSILIPHEVRRQDDHRRPQSPQQTYTLSRSSDFNQTIEAGAHCLNIEWESNLHLADRFHRSSASLTEVRASSLGGELNLHGRGETGCFRSRIASGEYVLSQGTYTDRSASARLPTASLILGDFVYLIRVEDMLRWCEEQKQTAIETERPKGRATIAKDVQEQAIRRQCEEEKQQVLAMDVKPSKVSGYQN